MINAQQCFDAIAVVAGIDVGADIAFALACLALGYCGRMLWELR